MLTQVIPVPMAREVVFTVNGPWDATNSSNRNGDEKDRHRILRDAAIRLRGIVLWPTGSRKVRGLRSAYPS